MGDSAFTLRCKEPLEGFEQRFCLAVLVFITFLFILSATVSKWKSDDGFRESVLSYVGSRD